MATTRQRRVGAHPEYAVDQDGDRLYTENDYAQPSLPHDEWSTRRTAYPPAGWTGESVLPDEAFQPDEADLPEEDDWSEEEVSYPYYAAEHGYDPRYTSGADYAEEADLLDEELLTEEEQAELNRSRWQLIAGLADFAGVVLGTASILLIVTVLMSLINWLVNDLSQSFILLQKNF